MMNDQSDTDDANGDGEGVWSPDIEQCFREALLLFPPCGRRKHILQEEGGGKMYGRNELIARHIMMRTGKVRTRKQVSSHIQVLARRKAKAETTPGNVADSTSPASSMSISTRPDSTNYQQQRSTPTTGQHIHDIWADRPVCTDKIRLLEFSAFVEYRAPGLQTPQASRHLYVEINYRHPSARQTNKLEQINIDLIHDKFPELSGPDGLFQRGPPEAFYLVKFWANLNNHEYYVEDQNSIFGFSSCFETVVPYKDITCSTKACSYGLQVVEKVEKIYGEYNSSNGRYSYNVTRSPMCEFMIQFIKKLRQLPRASQMNSVLENFTVLQVITCEATSEILLCLAYVFEIASPTQKDGSRHHVYKLTKY